MIAGEWMGKPDCRPVDGQAAGAGRV